MQKHKTINKKLTKEIKFSEKKIICNTFIRRGTGLMFHTKKSLNNKIWLFKFTSPRRVSITMMFVFFPIDIIFIKNNSIVELKENLKPFTFYNTKNEIDSFIELKQGTIKRKKINLGDKIIL